MGVGVAVEGLLARPGWRTGRVVDENDPRDGPGEDGMVIVGAADGEPVGNSGKGLISVSGIADKSATCRAYTHEVRKRDHDLPAKL